MFAWFAIDHADTDVAGAGTQKSTGSARDQYL